MIGTRRRDFKAQRDAELTLRQLALQRLAQVLHFLFVDPQVGIARHAKLRIREDVAARKQIAQVRVHDR